MSVIYAIDCPVCGDPLTAGATSSPGAVFSECHCGYLRLTPAGDTWIQDGRGDDREGYTVTRGLHVTKTEEATNARSRRTAGESPGDGGSDS